VIQLAGSLGVTVVAEGIERPDQRRRVLDLGGRFGQGYLLGEPLTADAVPARLGVDEPPHARERHLAS
jgi:EAL domain-containing protein (putative c-di-GMP-specific phosphodiesterase class I)